MLRRLILVWATTTLVVGFGFLAYQASTLGVVIAGLLLVALTFGLVCLLFARLPSPRDLEQ